MDSANKNNTITQTSSVLPNGKAGGSVMPKRSDRFDISMLGKIDLAEAEKIASEEVLFLTEADLIDGLEDFELVPIKNLKQTQDAQISKTSVINLDILDETDTVLTNLEPQYIQENLQEEPVDEIFVEEESFQIDSTISPVSVSDQVTDINLIQEESSELEGSVSNISITPAETITDINSKDSDIEDITSEVIYLDTIDLISELSDDIPDAKKFFSIKINEETLDAQLASILNEESLTKIDDKSLEKYNDIISDSKCRFADDQFLNKHVSEDTVSYNEDPLTERLVKMIEVADGKMSLLEVTAKEGDYFNYILEDYTLYNSEKFDTVFKEEVFYIDTDFEFIENAIIRDDFSKYIHEIDDYFDSEDSLIQSEISEILGLIPDEKDYIDDKLFGDYYKKFDLDNEIDFIKPEIDFFRSTYTGSKNLSYFTENEAGISDSERISIEEDISSANAIVFEEDISEIEEILLKDFGLKSESIVETPVSADEPVEFEEIADITDKIIILEDKEKLFELVSEFPEKHENLIKLLSYLDGLFEKLPEDVIRKFAESEYFELYSKVLKEIGV